MNGFVKEKESRKVVSRGMRGDKMPYSSGLGRTFIVKHRTLPGWFEAG